MYVCMYVYIYIHAYIHVYIYMHRPPYIHTHIVCLLVVSRYKLRVLEQKGVK